MKVPVVPHPQQHLVFLVFWILATLIGVEWYLIDVLLCIFLMTHDLEHLFICLFAICVSFFGDVSVKVFGPFLNCFLSVEFEEFFATNDFLY